MDLLGLTIIAVVVFVIAWLIVVDKPRPDSQPDKTGDHPYAAREVQVNPDNREDGSRSHRNYWRH